MKCQTCWAMLFVSALLFITAVPAHVFVLVQFWSNQELRHRVEAQERSILYLKRQLTKGE